LLVQVVLVGQALAGGFLNHHQSASSIGMSNATTARIDDPSACYYNPAAITYQPGLSVYVGAAITYLDYSYSDPEGVLPGADTTKKWFFPPAIYLTYGITDYLAVGVTLNSPHGIDMVWPEGKSFAGGTIATLLSLLLPLLKKRRSRSNA